MSRQRLLERERRWAPWAATAAFLAAVLLVVSVLIESGIDFGSDDPTDAEVLRAIGENEGRLLVSSILGGLGFLLLGGPLFHLFKAAEARWERVQSAFVGFAFLGPVLFFVQEIVGFFGQTEAAAAFAEQVGGAADREELGTRILEEAGTLEIAQAIQFPAVLGLVIGYIYIPLQALRAGLLTRFFATLGMALGASMIIIPPAALFGLLLWSVWVGLLFLGKTPGPRPPAWEAGEAVPWPKPGEESSQEQLAEPGELGASGEEGEERAQEGSEGARRRGEEGAVADIETQGGHPAGRRKRKRRG